MKEYRRQTRIYYIFNFINRFMVYMPVFVIFLNSKGFNQTQVMVMMSAYNISMLAGELPTGIIADRISRKLSVMLGCGLQGISMLCMLVSKDFFVFIIIEIVFGVGMTFQSGAMTAMFYDYLKETGNLNDFTKCEGRRWGCIFISQAIASILGGLIAKTNIGFTIIITAIAYLISAVILLMFKEVKMEVQSTSYINHLSNTLKNILTNKNLITLLVVMVLTQTLFLTTMWLYQPYFNFLGINVQAYGFIYFIMYSVSALGGIISEKVVLSKKYTIIYYTSITVILVGLMGFVNSLIGAILPAGIFFVMGVFNPWIQKYWEENINSNERATASSFLNVLSSLTFAIVAIPIGYLCDNVSISKAFSVPALSFGLIMIIFFMFISIIGKEKLKDE